MESTEIFLIRHGQTDHNFDSRIQGQIDTDLNQTGIDQAKMVALRLGKLAIFHKVFSSDLKRSHKTAQIICEKVNTTIQLRQELREISLGSWEGKNWKEIEEIAPDGREDFYRDWYGYKGHGGESFQDVYDRVNLELDSIVSSHPGQTVLIVSHGGPIRLIVQRILNCPAERMAADVENCSITQLRFANEQYHLVRMNDFAHLEGDSQPESH